MELESNALRQITWKFNNFIHIDKIKWEIIIIILRTWAGLVTKVILNKQKLKSYKH